MFRLRRYRVFVAFAVFTILALYKFSSSGPQWHPITEGSDQPKGGEKQKAAPLTWEPRPHVAQETKKLELDVAIPQTTQPKQTPPAIPPVSRPADAKPPSHAPTKPPASPVAAGTEQIDVDNAEATSVLADLEEGGVGRVEVMPPSSSVEAIFWSKQSEHFPVPTEKLIKLPQSKPKAIPKIQFAFGQESATEKAERVSKLDIIKGVFQKSWKGYKEHAWLHDELSPVSGNFRNPFASWGATLVDALDTLWIMGMKTEFEEAVKAIDKIDFKTTPRADIPLFETTIRYLGGFLAAYDLSDRKYESLLKKAVELAEVLISAFDTPNRMPQTYYYWRPAFASQPHRASNRVVLAEIGSLSVEFTRLAQLTGEHKYYDAIARITDYLDEFQNKTRLPGMWPTYLDASGCKHIDYSEIDTPLQKPLPNLNQEEPSEQPTPPTKTEEKLSPNGEKYLPLNLPPPLEVKAEEPTISPEENLEQALKVADKVQGIGESLRKRQLNIEPAPIKNASTTETAPATPTPTRPECEEQGFVSSSDYGNEEYTLGGMSDSTYEYLPKQWLLLGGVIDKYRTMYEASVDVVKDNLLFRPMLPKKDDILFSGKLFVPSEKPAKGNGELEGENAHLTCFAGGMFGMGAKIFNRPEDLKLAEKLTEGCVFSYNMTASGIMPESFLTVPCEGLSGCEWNETKYWDAIDPGADARMQNWKQQMDTYNIQMASASSWYNEQMAAFTNPPNATGAVGAGATPTATPIPRVEAELESGLEKRQLDVAEPETKPRANNVPSQNIADNNRPIPANTEKNLMIEGDLEDDDDIILPASPVQSREVAEPSPILPTFPSIYSPTPPLTHKEYVENRIQEERLPPGVTSIRARNYILRPEAIESVWYMYRITGNPYWREAGWKMFEAVNSHTSTTYGNSAIDDVTKITPDFNDEMESFWLAETLKYFYLLFAEESVVSLDEWVLNTEAHPFRRPK